ncbi:testis-expressed protein 47 [Hippoglossus stenolepis]|uniref:testis-expressed protein 47 n=1 Tax=Hippoglossus stenolepis TaxID=195615 RepID=UPI00159C59E8|nr:testis-expressed protein 47 [Hippoglossus stenolepis]XP_047194258.1 testis-expressed protein 47 [Hippoglossus stenolepis]
MERTDRLGAEGKKEEEETGTSLFHHVVEQRKDLPDEDVKIVLQRLILIGRLPHDVADRTELGDHYDRLHFQLSKQHIWDQMTGLLLVYPTCVLHVIESSRDVLLSVLKDLRDMQLQTDGCLIEAAKVVSMAHVHHSRMFHQWSYKVLDAADVDPVNEGFEEDEDSTVTLVCSLLSALHKLAEHLEKPKKTVPGSVPDDAPQLLVSQELPGKLLSRDELLSPQLHLQTYDSPLNISLGSGQVNRSSSLNTV